MKKPCLSRYQKQKLEKNRNDKKITIKLGNKMNESVDNKKNDNKLDTNQSQLDTEAITSGETPSSGTPSSSNKPEEANPPLGEVVGEVPAKVVIDENGEEQTSSFSSISSRVNVTFPYTPKSEYVDVGFRKEDNGILE